MTLASGSLPNLNSYSFKIVLRFKLVYTTDADWKLNYIFFINMQNTNWCNKMSLYDIFWNFIISIAWWYSMSWSKEIWVLKELYIRFIQYIRFIVFKMKINTKQKQKIQKTKSSVFPFINFSVPFVNLKPKERMRFTAK